MSVQKVGFRESVLFLKGLLGKIPNQNKDARPALNQLAAGIGQPMPQILR